MENRKVLTCAIFYCLFSLYAAPSWATMYYVAKTGVDTGRTCAQAQSTSTPLLTINKGIGCLAPGDTLWIGNGDYNEVLHNPQIGGTSWGQPVRIAAMAGNTNVWLKPQCADYPGEYYVVYLASSIEQFIEFEGINLRGCNGITASHGVAGDDTPIPTATFALQAGTWGNPNHIRYKNSTFIVGSRGPSGTDSGGCGVLTYTSTNLDDGGYNEFINLDISSSAGETVPSWYGYYMATSNNLIEGNTIHNVDGAGIWLYNTYGLTPHNIIVRNNRVHDITRTGTVGPGSNDIVGIGDTGIDNQIYNNIVYNLGSAPYVRGINPYGSTRSMDINNTVYNVAQEGLFIDGANSVIRNNISYNNGTNYFDQGSGTTEDHNLWGTDPQFVDAVSANFHLRSSSPARNTGTTVSLVTTDLDEISRPQEGAYDKGAYEYTGTSASACDVNRDGFTNVSDVQGAVNQALGTPTCVSFGQPGSADINQDGQCIVLDVQRVVNAALGGPCITNP